MIVCLLLLLNTLCIVFAFQTEKQRGSKGLKISGAQPGKLQVEIRDETDTSDSLENAEDRDDPLYENFLE